MHEILHAQYFNDVNFRNTVDKFWNELSVKERDELRSVIGTQYDASDDFLMRNEFQAYILQPGGDSPNVLLSKFVPHYRTKLIERLESAGVKPIQVNLKSK
jgi:hypothetical protein